MVDNYHDHSIEDCGTKHLVLYNIDTKQKLSQIDGRHYHDVDDSGKPISELKTIYKEDLDMIGKRIGLRSPITCAGHHVCRTCYGAELSEINKNVNTGLVAVLLLTNPLTQKLLSAKHLLTTNSAKVNWPDKFLDYFSVNMNSIYLKNPELEVRFEKISSEDGLKDTDLEEEDTPSTFKIDIYKGTKKVISFDLKNSEKDDVDTEMSTIKLLYEEVKSSSVSDLDEYIPTEEDRLIVLKGLDFIDEPMFTFVAENSELTRSLQDILDLIESSAHLGETDYHGMTARFNDLLIKNNLSMDSVHAEMIVSILIRDNKTNKKLDFSKDTLDPYHIIRVSKAVLLAPLSVSLAFERLDDQLTDVDTYRKDETSLMDYLYQ